MQQISNLDRQLKGGGTSRSSSILSDATISAASGERPIFAGNVREGLVDKPPPTAQSGPASSMTVELVPYSPGDSEAVMQLALRKDQENFVAPNSLSIEQAAEYPDFHLLTIRDKSADKIVGVLLYAFDSFPEDTPKQWWLYRIMIDKESQQRSYGTQALKALDQYLSSRGVTELYVPVCESNAVARRFYEKNGYSETGQIIEPDGVAVDLESEVIYRKVL